MEDYNVKKGDNALQDSTGGSNTVMGYLCLEQYNKQDRNSAIGRASLKFNSTGFHNTACGVSALYGRKSSSDRGKGCNNFAMGYQAGSNYTTGNYNSFLGYDAGYANKSANYNVAAGAHALQWNKMGNDNVAIGCNTLLGIGEDKGEVEKNTAVGFNSLKKSNNTKCNTAVGSETEISSCDRATAIGYKAIAKENDAIQLGNENTTVYCDNGYHYTSDLRDKTDVRDTTLGLNYLLKLRPVDFKWRHRGRSYSAKQLKNAPFHHGFIAQEIAALPEDFGGHQKPSKMGGMDQHSMNHSEFIAVIVKAVQEQQEILQDQQKINEHLKQNIAQARAQYQKRSTNNMFS